MTRKYNVSLRDLGKRVLTAGEDKGEILWSITYDGGNGKLRATIIGQSGENINADLAWYSTRPESHDDLENV